MTSTTLSAAPADAALPQWDEPAGVGPRGTLVLLTGRGETAASYVRFARRLSSDAYKVRIVEVDLDDLAATRAAVEELLSRPELPSPHVLIGSDTGATLAAQLVHDLPVDAAVLAGIALPGSASSASWDDELDVRSACPAYRGALADDATFSRGELARALPWDEVTLRVPDQPVLVLHGRADALTPVADALRPWVGAATVHRHVVEEGRHDILNDVTHRSVAATIVLFLERLRVGRDLPVIVRGVGG